GLRGWEERRVDGPGRVRGHRGGIRVRAGARSRGDDPAGAGDRPPQSAAGRTLKPEPGSAALAGARASTFRLGSEKTQQSDGDWRGARPDRPARISSALATAPVRTHRLAKRSPKQREAGSDGR